MQKNFPTIMNKLFSVEGGFANDPRDPGGETNLGVTALEWAKWRKVPLKTITTPQMQALTPQQVLPLYSAWYWDMVNGEELPGGVDAMVMHFEVNAGGISAKELQGIVGESQDGQIGSKTLLALNAYISNNGIQQTIWTIADAQMAYYKRLQGFATFGKGWTARVSAFEDLALELGSA